MGIKPGSKYYPLFEHLQQCIEKTIILTFADIETVIDNRLPSSASHKKNWWSNRASASALQAKAWVSAGYHVEIVDLGQQTVTFRKFQTIYPLPTKDGDLLWQQGTIKALRQHMSLTQAQFAQELGVRRQTVSEWENGVYTPDRSTTKFLKLIAQQSEFPKNTPEQQ